MQSDYNHYQTYLQSLCSNNNQTVNLYSATKQQAQRVLRRIQSKGKLNPKKQYPSVLRHDLIDIQKDSKFQCVYWMRIPVYPRSINVRIQTSCNYDLTAYEIRESKIIKNENEWYVFITIGQKSEPLEHKPTNILAIDLGCKNIAVTVNTANTRPNFYGSKLRQIRGFISGSGES
jgi:transposase